MAEFYQLNLNEHHVPTQTVVVESVPEVIALSDSTDLTIRGGIVDISLPEGERFAMELARDPLSTKIRTLFLTTKDPEKTTFPLTKNQRVLAKPFDLEDLEQSLAWIIKEEQDDND